MIMNSLLIQMIHLIIHLHNRRLIPAPVTIIRRREHGTNRSVVLPLIPLHNELMRPCDEEEIVDVGELFGNVLAEGVTRSSGGDTPAASKY